MLLVPILEIFGEIEEYCYDFITVFIQNTELQRNINVLLSALRYTLNF